MATPNDLPQQLPLYKQPPPFTLPTLPQPDNSRNFPIDKYWQATKTPDYPFDELDTSNDILKKVVLEEISRRPEIWSSKNSTAVQKNYPGVAVETFKRTGILLSLDSMQKIHRYAKDSLRIRLKNAVVRKRLTPTQVEDYLWKWELYPYIRHYREHMQNWEAELQDEIKKFDGWRRAQQLKHAVPIDRASTGSLNPVNTMKAPEEEIDDPEQAVRSVANPEHQNARKRKCGFPEAPAKRPPPTSANYMMPNGAPVHATFTPPQLQYFLQGQKAMRPAHPPIPSMLAPQVLAPYGRGPVPQVHPKQMCYPPGMKPMMPTLLGGYSPSMPSHVFANPNQRASSSSVSQPPQNFPRNAMMVSHGPAKSAPGPTAVQFSGHFDAKGAQTKGAKANGGEDSGPSISSTLAPVPAIEGHVSANGRRSNPTQGTAPQPLQPAPKALMPQPGSAPSSSSKPAHPGVPIDFQREMDQISYQASRVAKEQPEKVKLLRKAFFDVVLAFDQKQHSNLKDLYKELYDKN